MSSVRTALVVDDNELSAMFVALVLRREGFEVGTATNGLHGYSSYFHKPTDWVVTDIQMPELDGVEMMRFIRSINPNVRTVYMSGATVEHQAALDRERKEFDAKVLAKPFSRDALLHEIDY
jgi:CheY-like chemotaxis protein